MIFSYLKDFDKLLFKFSNIITLNSLIFKEKFISLFDHFMKIGDTFYYKELSKFKNFEIFSIKF